MGLGVLDLAGGVGEERARRRAVGVLAFTVAEEGGREGGSGEGGREWKGREGVVMEWSSTVLARLYAPPFCIVVRRKRRGGAFN